MEKKRYWYKRLCIVVQMIGYFVGLIGVFMIFPFLIACIDGDSEKYSFFYSMLICFGFGILVQFIRKKNVKNVNFGPKEGFITLGFSWIFAVVCGSLPYLFSDTISSFINAFFESMSGFTTTGASTYVSVATLPRSILLWRSISQWIGGIGIVVFFLSLLPAMGLAGHTLFTVEITGPIKDKISPRVRKTAKILIIVYLSLTFSEFLLLLCTGMNWFDAICYSMATVATGGFAPNDDSAMFCSPVVQWILIVFMFLSGINFTMFYFAVKRNWGMLKKNEEWKFYTWFTVVVSVLVGIGLYHTSVPEYSLGEAFRTSTFQCVSMLTTTGFVSAEYTLWHPALRLILLFLFFVGACAGSTSGAIKITRFILLVKNAFLQFKRATHPRAIMPLKFNGKIVSNGIVFKVLAFFFLYLGVFLLGTLLFAILGHNIETSIGLSASFMGNIGPAMGEFCGMCPMATLSLWGKLLACFLMLVGRLEVFTVLILFLPAFWKK